MVDQTRFIDARGERVVERHHPTPKKRQINFEKVQNGPSTMKMVHVEWLIFPQYNSHETQTGVRSHHV
jgi:hypothetical protein